MARYTQRGQTTLEFTIVGAAFVAVIFAVVSYGIDVHAQSIVQAAARMGAHAAARSTPAAGRDAANSYLSQVAPTLVENPRVTAGASATVLTVDVDGTARTPIAGWRMHVHGHAVEPLERFTADSGVP